jgi:hypothetical protein
MKISQKFFEFFSQFFAKSRDSLSFPEHFCEIPAKLFLSDAREIPAKFHQIFAEKSQISSKNENEKMKFHFHSGKNLDGSLLKF